MDVERRERENISKNHNLSLFGFALKKFFTVTMVGTVEKERNDWMNLIQVLMSIDEYGQ